MLFQEYEIWAVNNLGTDIDASTNSGAEHLKVFIHGWKFGSAGALEYDAGGETERALAVDLADGAASVLGAVVANSSDLFFGFNGRAEISSDDTLHDGSVDFYLVGGVTSGTNPADHANFNVEEDGIPIGSLTFNHDGTGTDVKGANIAFD